MVFAVLTLILMFGGVYSTTITRFTNLKCEVLDPSYCYYKECHLKVLGRGIIGVNVHAILLKGPFNNAKINLSLWRKYNGFRPYMYNVTLDFCKYMEKRSSKLSFQSLFIDAVADKSNVNHTCPYENDIHVKDLVFKEEYLKFLPAPSGEYKFQLMAGTDNDWKTIVYITATRQEDLMKT